MGDFFEDDPGEDNTVPKHIKTWSIPISAVYFNPSGFFAGTSVTYVHQDVSKSGNVGEGNDGFTVVDAAIGYRFPRRRGLLSLEALNLFDADLKFQDDSSRGVFEVADQRSSVRQFIPERAFLARLALNF